MEVRFGSECRASLCAVVGGGPTLSRLPLYRLRPGITPTRGANEVCRFFPGACFAPGVRCVHPDRGRHKRISACVEIAVQAGLMEAWQPGQFKQPRPGRTGPSAGKRLDQLTRRGRRGEGRCPGDSPHRAASSAPRVVDTGEWTVASRELLNLQFSIINPTFPRTWDAWEGTSVCLAVLTRTPQAVMLIRRHTCPNRSRFCQAETSKCH
jgi:hypothetical protein